MGRGKRVRYGDQLYTVLMTLVEGESFDILVGTGPEEGLKAWRRPHKRWDPLTKGRARGLLREILSPGRAKLVELQGAVERLEDLMRRYTQRRDARNGRRHALAEAIRMAVLESLPTSRGKVKNPTGKGKGAGKDGAKFSEKIQGQCCNFGKTDYQAKDCWARPQQQQNQGESNSSGKGNETKGKSSKGGKKCESKDAGALVWNQQTETPVVNSVTSSASKSETSTTVGTIDTIECTSLDLCAQEIVNPRWIAFNVDTGAGGTVWPMNADYACEKISGPAGRNYKTATGEMVEGRVRCQGVGGHQLHMTGEKTSVHVPLLSAGDVTDKGHALWLDGDVGCIIQKDSPMLTAMRTCFGLYGQVAGGDGTRNELSMSVPMKWRLKLREVVHRAASGRRTRKTERNERAF